METTNRRSSPTHKYIGYTIGILGILVSAVVIYGDDAPLFPARKLTPAEREKGLYENMVPYLGRFHFVTFVGWLLAVYTDKLSGLMIVFGLWVIGLGSAALCAYFYNFEGIPREFKEREIFLIAGTAYWTCSLIIAGIWFVTRRMDEPSSINEAELTPIK